MAKKDIHPVRDAELNKPGNKSENPGSFSAPASGIKKISNGVHPPYQTARIQCACGNTFEVGSTKKELEIEICSKCHPFYTGGSKLIDTAGRVEKFKQRLAKRKIKD